ncbi:nucleotidyltransferase domain-containing protein [uncultured Pseudoteredinibacter sp.]|uniref:nucleotidyltransferase domain-containing protein n=1 Tax=uncultured Pseudoteredinibacter sp. TaxID=1641701 RepID=UPI00260224B6|nr:nucleotidyltransferase domain-containing protein [uncultured Pseudoteredinibacter sp.]
MLTQEIIEDVYAVRNAVNGSDVFLFGSVVKKGFDKADDIDLLVFYENISFENAKLQIERMTLSRAVHVERNEGMYDSPGGGGTGGGGTGGGGKPAKKYEVAKNKPFHIVLCSRENFNPVNISNFRNTSLRI